MLKLNKDQLRQPVGGHHFIERGLMIRGDTPKQVIKKITEYRINNNFPVGNPEQDLLLYYAERWPYMVRHDFDAQEEAKVDDDYEGWRSWIYKIWNNPPASTVSSKEASDRWDVCKTCIHNKRKSWVPTNEASEITRRAFILRRGLDIPTVLGYCSLHKADLGVFCFVEKAKEISGLKKDTAKPSHCWV